MLVKKPISFSKNHATKVLITPISMAIKERGMTCGVVVKSPSFKRLGVRPFSAT